MKYKQLHIIKFKISPLILFVLSFFSKSFAAGESDFPPNYYDTVALLLLLIIVITLLSIIYYEGKSKVLKEKKVSKWFIWLFYITIFFGIYYILHFQVFATGNLSQEQLERELKTGPDGNEALVKSGAMVNEEIVTQLTDAASLQVGKQIYDTNCIACHAADGGGIVGPNLTDKYWILGGGIKNVFKTTKYGVVEKGMISWQTQLNAKQIQEVASYVLSLQGTTPANPKPPEGEIWTEEESE